MKLLTQAAKSKAAARPARRRLPRVVRQTLQTDVYNAIRHALMTGHFRPGEPLTLRDLAKALGTSMMPVRDALLRLVAEGALEMRPNRTAVLPLMTRTRLRQLYRMRVALDGMLVEEAAKHVTPADLKTLESLTERMDAAAASVNVNKYLELNQQFHFILYRASGESVLLRISEMLWLQVGPFIYFSLTELGMVMANKHHRAALAALKRGDAKAACKAIESDVAEAAESIMDALPEGGM